MRGCKGSCAHRSLVMGYRHARAAADAADETLTGYAARDDAKPSKVTFKRWLKDNRVPEEYR